MSAKAYWGTTTVFSAVMLFAGVGDILRSRVPVEHIVALGYPVYLATILGVAKLFGVPALLAPFAPIRLKEWAYAGFFFLLAGAVTSHIVLGEGLDRSSPPLVLLALGAGSYVAWRRRASASTSGRSRVATARLA